MKIKVEEILNQEETEVIVRCFSVDEEVKKLISTLRLFEEHLLGKLNDRTYPLHPKQIFYFESVDNKVFAYTEKETYETTYKLYELEDLLKNTSFLRVNKTTILDAGKITSFRSAINGRMEAILKNGEKIIVSRTYVGAIKMILGGK